MIHQHEETSDGVLERIEAIVELMREAGGEPVLIPAPDPALMEIGLTISDVTDQEHDLRNVLSDGYGFNQTGESVRVATEYKVNQHTQDTLTAEAADRINILVVQDAFDVGSY